MRQQLSQGFVCDSDALDLMLSLTWVNPIDAMPLVVAIARQIAEGIYQAEEKEE